MSVKGIFNALMRAAPEKALRSPEDFLNWFLEMDIPDFTEMRGFGPQRIELVRNIQKRIKDDDNTRKKLLDRCRVLIFRGEEW